MRRDAAARTWVCARLQEIRSLQGRILQEKDKSKETTHTVKQELRSSAQVIEVRPLAGTLGCSPLALCVRWFVQGVGA